MPEAEYDEHDGPPVADWPHPKSRLIGGLLLFLGVVMAGALVTEGPKLGGRLLALLVLLGVGGTWVGIGLLLFPWTRGMVAGFTSDNNAMLGFKRLPPLWKAWLVVALLATVGGFVAAIKLKDDRAAVVAPAR